MANIPIEKNTDKELPVPTLWRAALKELADSFVYDEFNSLKSTFLVRAIDNDIVKINKNNIEKYPDQIGLLMQKSWDTSIYVWTGKDWVVSVDLSTSDGETSDLVLHTIVREVAGSYNIEAGLIYVP